MFNGEHRKILLRGWVPRSFRSNPNLLGWNPTWDSSSKNHDTIQPVALRIPQRHRYFAPQFQIHLNLIFVLHCLFILLYGIHCFFRLGVAVYIHSSFRRSRRPTTPAEDPGWSRWKQVLPDSCQNFNEPIGRKHVRAVRIILALWPANCGATTLILLDFELILQLPGSIAQYQAIAWMFLGCDGPVYWGGKKTQKSWKWEED